MGRKLQLVALDELRRTFDQYAHSADVMDDKARGLLSASSFIVALFSLLQLSFVRSGQSCIYQAGVVLIIVGYLILVALCVEVFYPREYKNAISTEWNALSSHFLEKEESEAYATLLSTYLNSIEENRKTNLKKARYLYWSARVFPALVVGLFLLSLLPH